MLVAPLLHVLPNVLKASQLCSVRGRSIFDGAAAILSVSEYLHRRNLPGFLLSLDFFHAFDRVSLQLLDRVLEAMGFGLVLRQWVATLHRRATACFMLHSLSPDQEVEFSIRQGDPAASVFFTIYIEPFLACLERFLHGLFMGGLREATLSYMDDVNELGEDEQDILVTGAGLLRPPRVPSSIATERRSSLASVPGLAAGTGPCPGSRRWTRPRSLGLLIPQCSAPLSLPPGTVSPPVWRGLSRCGPPAACPPSASAPWRWKPLPCPRLGIWPKSCPSPPLLLPASAVRLGISSGAVGLSGWLMTSCMDRSLRVASELRPFRRGLRPC